MEASFWTPFIQPLSPTGKQSFYSNNRVNKLVEKTYRAIANSLSKMVSLLAVFILVFFRLPSSMCKSSTKGRVEDVLRHRMYHCSEEDKLTYSSPSQIHCVSKCSMEKRCRMVNYLPRNLKLQNNCEVISNFCCWEKIQFFIALISFWFRVRMTHYSIHYRILLSKERNRALHFSAKIS